MVKKGLVVFLLMLLTMSIPRTAQAQVVEEGPLYYLNLGDSIAWGMSAFDASYYESYGTYLEPYGLISMPNDFARPGLTSSQFLEFLTSESNEGSYLRMQIAQSDLITISLGGNNLLGPLVGALYNAYGLTPSQHTMVELLFVIDSAGPERWQEIIQGLTWSLEDPSALGGALELGVVAFEEEWSLIAETLSQINPEASIIPLTLYNPFEKESHRQLHALFEPWVKRMNLALKKSQGRNLSLADVHGSFAKEEGDVLFCLEWPLSLEKLDPHPTALGHQLIFQALTKSRNIQGLLAS